MEEEKKEKEKEEEEEEEADVTVNSNLNGGEECKSIDQTSTTISIKHQP